MNMIAEVNMCKDALENAYQKGYEEGCNATREEIKSELKQSYDEGYDKGYINGKPDMLDKIKDYVNHIRNTGMGKTKSLEFIEKFVDGLKAESEDKE